MNFKEFLNEDTYRVSVTLSDPNATAVSKRKEQIARTAKVTASDKDEAIKKAEAFYKKKGYKVHSSELISEANKELDAEYIMQKLADRDINSKIDDKYVYVDKDDVATAKKILRSIGCTKTIKEL